MPEAIGNPAEKYSDKVLEAIPNLLQNTTENGINTMVARWCAAYGFTEIVKNNSKMRKHLLSIFLTIVSSEKDNGVRNVYSKVLKVIEKEKQRNLPSNRVKLGIT